MIELKNLRIRRLDDRNLVIERWTEPVKVDRKDDGWRVWRYYGKFEDLAKGLLNLVVDIPASDDLAKQIRLLIQTVQETERSISEQLKTHHNATDASERQILATLEEHTH